MTTMIDTRGEEVSTEDYMSMQSKLVGSFCIDMLDTGPEWNGLSDEEKDALYVLKQFDGSKEAYTQVRSLSGNSMVSYLTLQWMSHFRDIVGSLSRIERRPVQVVEAEVLHFQSRVVANIGVLRYLWLEKTCRVLAIQTASEQVRWNGPRVAYQREFPNDPESPGEYYLAVDALLPHVCTQGDTTDLLFDSNHVMPQTLRIPIAEENSTRIKKDLAKSA